MPVPAYMQITGTRSGPIHTGAMSPESVGTLSKADKENWIQVQGFRQQIYIPRDPQTGAPVGRRVHQGVTITKIFDSATAQLAQILATGEQLSSILIHWYRTSRVGQQEHYFTHSFEEATIVDITQHMPNCLDPQMSSFSHMEDITFTYKMVEWNHMLSAKQGHDSWDGV